MTPAPPPPWRERLVTVVVAFLAARALVLGLWAWFNLNTQHDVLYYWQRTHLHVLGTPAADTLIEYPTPVLWLMQVPYWLAGQSRPWFVVVYVALMLLLDVGFAVALWRAGGPRRHHAVLFWVAFTLVMGPTTYMRFDLLPAVLGGLAVLALLPGRRDEPRSVWAGGLVGLGAALKLWPALLWPATFVGDRRQVLRASAGFWGVGGALALGSLAYGGWQRLVTPLTWQQGRGLQVESIWATVPMAVRAFTPGDFRVAVSRWQAFEIAGPGTAVWLQLSTIATVVGMAAVVGGYWLWLRRRRRTVLEAGLLMLLVVTVTIVTNKTFSPQYMMWLGGPMAALVVAGGRVQPTGDELGWPQVKALAWWVLGLTLGTQLVYPILYEPLVHGDDWLMRVATAVLVVRNVAMVGFTAVLVRMVWRMLGAPVVGETRAERRRRLRRES